MYLESWYLFKFYTIENWYELPCHMKTLKTNAKKLFPLGVIKEAEQWNIFF